MKSRRWQTETFSFYSGGAHNSLRELFGSSGRELDSQP